MKKFSIKSTNKRPFVLVTSKGTEVFEGNPTLVSTKFGSYLIFNPFVYTTNFDLIAKHRVYDEYQVQDGSKATVFLQKKDTKGIFSGQWHVNAKDVNL